MGKELDGDRTAGVPDEKTERCGAESADHPKNALHVMPPLHGSNGLWFLSFLRGWMRQVPAAFANFPGGFHGLRGNGTLCTMDSVRFGRALGIGTRLAAKTAKAAMDAATAPNPSTKSSADSRPPVANEAEPAARLSDRVTRTAAQVQQTGMGLKEGSRRFGTAVGKPLVKLSTVLWLEVTGVFFGLFAMAAGGAAWRLRAAMHATATNHEEHVRFLAGACMAAVFGYFCLTSFVKANRRSRQS